MAINVHFTAEDWQRIERDWTAWWHGETDRPMVMIEEVIAPPGATVVKPPMYVTGYPLEMPAEEALAAYTAYFEAKRYHADAFPHWFPFMGPAFLAAFVGAHAEVAFETAWLSPAREVPIEDLRLTYDPANRWWLRAREILRAAVTCWGDQVSIAHTDLGGGMDSLAHLLTSEKLLLSFYDAPSEVERLVQEITALWLRYYDELYDILRVTGRCSSTWAQMWAPGRSYMLQSDFSYMLSPRMFERYVLPELAACCDRLDYAFFHLDGKGEIPHLPMLLSLERLRGIQWLPGDGAPPPQEWLSLLKRIRDGGKLCQVYVSARGALTIARELGGRGFAFKVGDPMSGPEARDFVELLSRESG